MKRNTKLLLIAGMILGTISTTSCDINSIIDSILGNTPDDPTPGENEGGNENENENEGGNDNTGGNESSGGDDSTGDDNTSGDDENQPGNENQGPTVDSSSTINIKKASGYQESAFVEFEKIENLTLSNYKVSYKKNTDISYTTLDSNLIRENNDTVRCDILGLSKGVYTVKIETLNSTTKYSSTIDNINVINFDRSGFAHYKLLML